MKEVRSRARELQSRDRLLGWLVGGGLPEDVILELRPDWQEEDQS